MPSFKPALLFVCAMIILLPLTMRADQLLQQPGFEPPACSGGDWAQTSPTYACVNGYIHSGSWAMWGKETDPANLGRFFQNVTLTPGNWYTIDGWIKTENVAGGNGVVLGLAYVDSFGVTPADGQIMEIGFGTGSTDWTYFVSAPFQLPGMPADASFLWYYGDFSGATGQAWFDDVSLDTASVPEPASVLLVLTGLGALARKLGRA